MKLLHFLRDVMKEESTFTVNKAKVHSVKSNEVIMIKPFFSFYHSEKLKLGKMHRFEV